MRGLAPKQMNLVIAAVLICVALVGCGMSEAARIDPTSSRHLAVAQPEAAGMSSERLERLSTGMQKLVDDGELSGIVTAVARRGKLVHFETFGQQDIASGTPMAEDSLFRIYSMSKPITGVALMMLYEEGHFALKDPVSKYIPELKGLKVAAGEGRNGPILEDADHEMTIRELMSHSGGLSYGFSRDSQVDKMYRDAGVLDRDSTLKEMVDKLAVLPLHHQPGSKWHYSVSVDVQGYLVEVLSGQSFDEFLQQRIFEPLGMTDTAFWVPAEKADRFAQVYGYDDDRELVPREGPGTSRDPSPYLTRPALFSGGGGLVGSTMDYVRFCQMMLNGGELDGVRLLSPLTVSLMTRDQLPPGVSQSPGVGFGLDFAVVNDPVQYDGISKGEYQWGGAAGTWFWIDPVEDLVFVGMIQHFGQGMPDVRSISKRLTYQAILDANGAPSH